MRHALILGSRFAALAAVPMMSDGRLAGLWRRFMNELLDRYRPERHYMRGPGPKWREKHGRPIPASVPIPKFASIRSDL